MPSRLADRDDIRKALNGLSIEIDASANETFDDRIDEADAYIIDGWGAHPADEASADFLARRRALILMLGNWFTGDFSAIAQARACANIRFNENEGD